MDGSKTRGLAAIVKLLYNKNFSKYNQESAWTIRPLRRGQIHYAALDAVSVLYILKKFRSDQEAKVLRDKEESKIDLWNDLRFAAEVQEEKAIKAELSDLHNSKNIAAINLSHLIEQIRSELSSEMESKMQLMKEQLKNELLNELLQNYDLVPKKPESNPFTE